MSVNEKHWGHYIPKTKGDAYIQHCVMLWRKSKQYPDWLPHLLSYIPYDKLDSCMIWMQAIDSECGNVRNWEKQDEKDIHGSLEVVCKSISAILHIIGKLPRTKQMEYSLVYDDFSEEYVDVQFLPEIVEEDTNTFLSDQIMRMLKYDMEPMMMSSIVGIVDSIEKLSIPFVDKNGIAHHFLERGLNVNEVKQILADHNSSCDSGALNDLYPVEVYKDTVVYRFPDYDEKMKNFDSNKGKYDAFKSEIQTQKDISHPKDMPFLEYVDTVLDHDNRGYYYELEELISFSEFRYDECVNAAKYVGLGNALHDAVLTMFSRPIENREPAF